MRIGTWAAVAALGLAGCLGASAEDLAKTFPLKLVLVGEAGSERVADYAAFLEPHFAGLEVKDRRTFTLGDIGDADVVLLDWPQGEEAFPPTYSPLGKHGELATPAVLLGSAGLQHAVATDSLGGYGCTCLDPFAFAMKVDHDVFQTPIAVDPSKTIQYPFPDAWESERDALKDAVADDGSITVFPVVKVETRKNFDAGWCTAAYQFDQAPEVEVFSGGINTKMSTHGALWRQGNLFHYGFHQTPSDLNDAGKALLLNAIVYISRFTDDRPIAESPSIFRLKTAPNPRKRIELLLAIDVFDADALRPLFHDSVQPDIGTLSKPRLVAWFDTHRSYLYAEQDGKIALDQAAEKMAIDFEAPEFFPRAIAALKEGGAGEKDVRAMLGRYVAAGPKADAPVEDWEAWWSENKDYLFFSESGWYQWYIDPLAKARKVPSKDLVGAARASRPAPEPGPQHE